MNNPNEKINCPCPSCSRELTNRIHQNDRYKHEAMTVQSRISWKKLPNLAAIFENRPASNNYWHELMAFVEATNQILRIGNR